MNIKEQCLQARDEMRHHLLNELLPFWKTHGVDREHGGYLTYFDKDGNPTGEDVKTLICQLRMIFTYSSIYRANLDPDGAFLEMAAQGVDFVLKHFWDEKFGGWYWTAQRDGTPIDKSKIMYGQSFGVYSMSEYAMASGDPRGMEMALKSYESIKVKAADVEWGGFGEFFEEDWSPKRPGVYGGDRKGYDVHMHLMEAFTNLYEATGDHTHKRETQRVINLLFNRIIHPEHGTGIAQFAFDWTPQRAILFRNVWGADRDVEDDEGRPLDNTSFGHNVEFAWLLKHAIDILGLDLAEYRGKMEKLFDHCVQWGIDWEKGGVFCEGPNHGPARERNKEFWQQAECLIGFADAYLIFREEKYWKAYHNLHRFVMDVMINHPVGEWWPLFDENNNLLWTHMAHAWKINYHTVRSAIQTERRLNKILSVLDA
ncbi:MAG TPA: AGE family epimerase/isomerase [Candidatus Hydrogenedentes bacterium]|nr:AGE family epimerase/isomerase [Candidatus Hydrogenedentota bacterium]